MLTLKTKGNDTDCFRDEFLLYCNMIFFISLDVVIDNTRYTCLEFDIKQDAVLHGFAGYFDTILYDNVTLSKS